jgi:hypothetical protein
VADGGRAQLLAPPHIRDGASAVERRVDGVWLALKKKPYQDQIIDVMCVSNLTGEGVDAVRAVLRDQGAPYDRARGTGMVNYGREVPLGWFKFHRTAQELVKDGVRRITLDQAKAVGRECRVEEEELEPMEEDGALDSAAYSAAESDGDGTLSTPPKTPPKKKNDESEDEAEEKEPVVVRLSPAKPRTPAGVSNYGKTTGEEVGQPGDNSCFYHTVDWHVQHDDLLYKSKKARELVGSNVSELRRNIASKVMACSTMEFDLRVGDPPPTDDAYTPESLAKLCTDGIALSLERERVRLLGCCSAAVRLLLGCCSAAARLLLRCCSAAAPPLCC